MPNNLQKTELIVDLLRQTTSLTVVREFLQSKDLPHSAGSWEDMLSKRIQPAVTNRQITNDDLISLLRAVEECGHQHIFLYTCPKAKAIELLDRVRITNALRRMELAELLTTPKILEQPPQPEIVDVRWETAKVDLNLTIKEIELRKFQKLFGSEIIDGKVHKIYDLVEERAVNVAKLHRDGLLEIRIASLASTTKYEAEVHRFWKQINRLIPVSEFSELSLSNVKERLWVNRASLGQLIRYSDSTVRDAAGNVLRAASGADTADLNTNQAVGQSLDFLLDKDKNSYCEGANLWFKKTDGLSTDVHVLLTGDSNEFALPANCSEEDYKYVLDQLRHFNQRIS